MFASNCLPRWTGCASSGAPVSSRDMTKVRAFVSISDHEYRDPEANVIYCPHDETISGLAPISIHTCVIAQILE